LRLEFRGNTLELLRDLMREGAKMAENFANSCYFPCSQGIRASRPTCRRVLSILAGPDATRQRAGRTIKSNEGGKRQLDLPP
jgi:hypothetical protein